MWIITPWVDVQVTGYVDITDERTCLASHRNDTGVRPWAHTPVSPIPCTPTEGASSLPRPKSASRKRRTIAGSTGNDAADARTARTSAEAKHACARVPATEARHAGEGADPKALHAIGIIADAIGLGARTPDTDDSRTVDRRSEIGIAASPANPKDANRVRKTTREGWGHYIGGTGADPSDAWTACVGS